jgi:hypothetical protein
MRGARLLGGAPLSPVFRAESAASSEVYLFTTYKAVEASLLT